MSGSGIDLAQAAAWHRQVSAMVAAADRAGVAGAQLPAIQSRLATQASVLAETAARIAADSALRTPLVVGNELLIAIDEAITTLTETLNGVGDDSELANVDLQNFLQKQQQTLQMMSNISKMLYDTALAVIRNLGG